MMSNFVETNTLQQMVALELTKLIVEKSPAENMNEENIFSVFKRATKVVIENSPLKALLEKFDR